MQSQDLPEHNQAHGLGGQAGQESDTPGFLAGKLGLVTEEAAPDSFAGIQARLLAERRRRRGGFWLWATGFLLIGGLLLGWLWQGQGTATSTPQASVRSTTLSPAEVAGTQAGRTEPGATEDSLTDQAAARTSMATPTPSTTKAGTSRPILADRNSDPIVSSNPLPIPTGFAHTPADQLPTLSKQAVAPPAKANPKPEGGLPTRMPADMAIGSQSSDEQSPEAGPAKALASMPAAVPPTRHYSQPKDASSIALTAPERASPDETAAPPAAPTPAGQSEASKAISNQFTPKAGTQPAPSAGLAASTTPSSTNAGTDKQAASVTAPAEVPSSPAKASSGIVSAPAMPDAAPKSAPAASSDSAHRPLGSPASSMASQPLPAKGLTSDSGSVAPATVMPTTPARRPSKWQTAFGGGAGIFNRQVLVPNAVRSEFEPTGLRSGLAISLNGSVGYRIANGLSAELGLGLLRGQATLSQRQYGSGSGLTYQATGSGFTGTPLSPPKTVDSHLAYTLASLQAGIAWQPHPRWRVGIKAGVQQTLQQQAPFDGTPLPTFSFPVGAALMGKLAGPIWAGAEVSYFGSGTGQSNSAALFMLQYRRQR